jgi:hypothetical protein
MDPRKDVPGAWPPWGSQNDLKGPVHFGERDA